MSRSTSTDVTDRSQAKMARGEFMPYAHADVIDTNSSTAFNPQMSDSDIPLTDGLYQKWDKDGRAMGYAGDPMLHAPQPTRPSLLAPGHIPANPSDPARGEVAGSDTRGALSRDSVDSIGWDMQHDATAPSQAPGRVNYPRVPEATGDNNYGGYRDGYSRMSPTELGQRAFSPPPPTYRTDVK